MIVREVRCVQHLNAGIVLAIEWRHRVWAAGVLGVCRRVEPKPQMVGLHRGSRRILICIREWRIVEDFRCRRDTGGNDECLDAEAPPVREHEFGVWKFFEKVAAQHPSFQFFHGYGLGVLIPGDRVPAPLAPLLEASRENAHQIRAAYATLGGALTARAALGQQHREIEAHNTEHAQSLGEVERLKALIATTASERDQAVNALAERHREIEVQNAEHAQLLGEIEALKALIATTASERDQAVAALADRHREIEAQNTKHAQSLGEIEALKALIATTASERDQAVAALAAGREALASSRASLTEAERSTGLLQATLAGRDGALAEMSQRADEFVAALESAEAKLAKRDDALSRAESEIIALRSALAVAQDVGRAALAALRTEPATVPEAPRNAGWLALALRPFGFRGRDPLPVGRVVAGQDPP
jgi:hypothetical protein